MFRSDKALCPVCCEQTGHHVHTDPTWSRDIFACDNCRVTFVSPPVEQNFAAAPASMVQTEVSENDRQAAAYTFTAVQLASHKKFPAEDAAGENARVHAARPSIMDVGCGPGHMLAYFEANGWDVRGVDPWVAAATAGWERYRIPIEPTRIEDAKIKPQSQDIITAIDVLQFVGKPLDFLAVCRSTLKPGGLIYLTVPNFGSVESRRDGWKWQRFLPWCYVNYFTEASLHRLLGNAGFFGIKITAFGGPDEDGELRVAARTPAVDGLSWEDIAEEVPDDSLPILDRRDIDLAPLSDAQRSWRENGYVIVNGLIPEDVIDRYCAVRIKQPHAMGWDSSTPYHDVPEIRDLCLYKPLTELLEALLGEPMGLHLNLTGWVSTERDWHQDDYLNPPVVNGHYAAVWTALDEIKPNAGPFEFIPGSHRWPIIRQARILRLLDCDDGDPYWPWDSERLLTPFFEREIKQRGAKIERFLGGKGDVLIWHSRLLHRGSLAQRPGAERRSMIAHYSAVKYRPDMPHVRQHPGGGLYFVVDGSSGHPLPPRWYRSFLARLLSG
jgi:2-polyprenyl-3-methyl-5-hydroxy-6-metoxy-1,4-benzoquinol methylase